MDVRRTSTQRVRHDGVDEFDDRGFVDEGATHRIDILVLALENLDVVFVVDLG